MNSLLFVNLESKGHLIDCSLPFLFLYNRIHSQLTKYLVLGGIAQLARAPALQAGGLGFESPYLQKV